MSNFVHLHVHSQYSLLDGAAELKGLIKKALLLGMPAVALTDHGVMYGSLKFYQAAKKEGIKPILGCELYLAPRGLKDKQPKLDEQPTHLVLLAENQLGYQNLLQLVSIAHLEGFYYKPRIDLATLRQYSQGLIALSACLAGEIPRLLLSGREVEAVAQVATFQEIFGAENYFLELQNQGLEGQRQLNRGLARLSELTGAPLVATNDVHYLEREDALMHDVLLCIQTGKTMQDPQRMKFASAEFYFKTQAEMAEVFFDYPEACANTLRIAVRCEVSLELGKLHLPGFALPEKKTPAEFLEELCRAGITAKNLHWDEIYEARLQRELKVITQMNFPGYFLIVHDFVHFAEAQGIPVGPGRGSAAGSLVAYLLGITKVDPLQFGLLFERFLNPERISMPDIDIDFCFERRGEVISYVRQRYGAERVAQIITFGTMAARAAIRDVGRVMGMPYAEVDRVAKLIPHELGITLQEAWTKVPELTALVAERPQVGKLLEIALKVEGFPRHASTHAAGVVIASEALTRYLPLALSNEDEIITQFTMDEIEMLGLLKMDFLGLRTLTVLRDTLELIKQHRGLTLNLNQISLDDSVAYQLLQAGLTLGIFQLESGGITRLLMQLKPESIEDLAALLALYRPGPLGSGMVEEFVKRRHGEAESVYLHPLLEPILKETYGVILYQEQVMRIASDLGGFSLGEADLVRRAMGKKKPEVLAAMREQFVQGAVTRGIATSLAQEIFDLMEFFSGYGFNKSHSVAYALVAYQTAYFKANYPQEYLAALLTSVMGNPEKIGLYIEEARHMKLPLLHPDVNLSQAVFIPEQNGIRFGLLGIKNLGMGAIERIIAARVDGAYISLANFCERLADQVVNRRVIESLIRAGAFDFTQVSRQQMLAVLDQFLERYSRHQRNQAQLSLLEFLVMPEEELPLPGLPEFNQADLLKQEKEYLGVYLSGHPLEAWREKFLQNGVISIAELAEENEGKEVLIGGIVTTWKIIQTKRGATMAGARVEDLTGSLEVVVFPKIYGGVKDGYQPERVVVVKGRLEHQEAGLKLLAFQWRWLST